MFHNSWSELTINVLFLGQIAHTPAFHCLIDSPDKHSINGSRLHAWRKLVSLKIKNSSLLQFSQTIFFFAIWQLQQSYRFEFNHSSHLNLELQLYFQLGISVLKDTHYHALKSIFSIRMLKSACHFMILLDNCTNSCQTKRSDTGAQNMDTISFSYRCDWPRRITWSKPLCLPKVGTFPVPTLKFGVIWTLYNSPKTI